MKAKSLSAGMVVAIGCCFLLATQVDSTTENLPTADEILDRVDRFRRSITDIQIRVRQETTVPSGQVERIPELTAGKVEIIFASKGKKRYFRQLSLGDSSFAEQPNDEPAVDMTRVFDGRQVIERSRRRGARTFRYSNAVESSPLGLLPTHGYLWNIGLALPDTASPMADTKKLHRLGNISTLLMDSNYDVASTTEEVEGGKCVVLSGSATGHLPYLSDSDSVAVADRLWLAIDHRMTLRKRELTWRKRIVEIVNTQFEEVPGGVRLPRHSKVSVFELGDEPNGRRRRLLWTRVMSLRMALVNQAPDDLFFALSRRKVARQLPEAHHWRIRRSRSGIFSDVEEGWELRGVKRRLELSAGKPLRLVSVVVDQPEATFRYDVARNHLRVSRSELHIPTHTHTRLIHRDTISRSHEAATALFASAVESRNGKETQRITYIVPSDPLRSGNAPIHHIADADLSLPEGNGFRSRTYWWDQHTGYLVSRGCGCTPANHGELLIDYPQPEEIPQETFVLQIDPETSVSFDDPKLKQYFAPTVSRNPKP